MNNITKLRYVWYKLIDPTHSPPPIFFFTILVFMVVVVLCVFVPSTIPLIYWITMVTLLILLYIYLFRLFLDLRYFFKNLRKRGNKLVSENKGDID